MSLDVDLPGDRHTALISAPDESAGIVSVPNTPYGFIQQWSALLKRLEKLADDIDTPAQVKAKAMKDMGGCLKEIQSLMKEHASSRAAAGRDLMDMIEADPDQAEKLISDQIDELILLREMIRSSREPNGNGNGAGKQLAQPAEETW